jgi:hypothetical protein
MLAAVRLLTARATIVRFMRPAARTRPGRMLGVSRSVRRDAAGLPGARRCLRDRWRGCRLPGLGLTHRWKRRRLRLDRIVRHTDRRFTRLGRWQRYWLAARRGEITLRQVAANFVEVLG